MTNLVTIDNAAIERQLGALNRSLSMYGELTSKSPEDVVMKNGVKLAFNLSRRLKENAPKKDQVTAEMQSAMLAGRGIQLSKGARAYADKHTIATESNIKSHRGARFMQKTRSGNLKRNGQNWWQVAVKRELRIRESARGFVSYSVRYRDLQRKLSGKGSRRLANYFDRTNRFLAEANIEVGKDGSALTFRVGGGESANKAAKGLSTAKSRKAISSAIADTTADVMEYVNRKLAENARKAGVN